MKTKDALEQEIEFLKLKLKRELVKVDRMNANGELQDFSIDAVKEYIKEEYGIMIKKIEKYIQDGEIKNQQPKSKILLLQN